MKVNEQRYELIGMTHDDFLKFCKMRKLPSYKRDSKVLFFKLCRENKIEKVDGNLIIKE